MSRGFLERWSKLKKAADKAATSEITDAESLLANLSPDSDFGQFLREEISEEIRRKAMKTLFADPHFNVMDGLDTYIDDYNKEDPLPRSVMRQLRQARSLGLIDDELEEQDLPHIAAAPAADPSTDSPPPADAGANPSPAPHEDADLQLQRDDAAGRPGPEPGAAPDIAGSDTGDDPGRG